jgi:glycosyltransferase involved in cell wall biosynthesis
MKVILSAFNCEPGVGSEEAVGWGWVIGLAARCDKVLVVTRSSNQGRIDAWLTKNTLSNVEFLYFKPSYAKLFDVLGRFKWIPFYIAWHGGIMEPIRAAMSREKYDLVHHVTVVSMRFPLKLGELGIPFIYGPIAGGDEAPKVTWEGMSWRGRLGESLRRLSNLWIERSPGVAMTLERSSAILVVSPETKSLVPSKMHPRTFQVLAISYDEPLSRRIIAPRPSAKLRLLFAARCLDWKGLHLGLPAIALALESSGVDIHLTVIGEGPARTRWQHLGMRLGVTANITWVDHQPRDIFIQTLPDFDALFFPSLHDSGGMVVLESLANGLPVICLDAGGPGQLVDHTCGIKVRMESRDQIVQDLAAALVRFSIDEDLRHSMAIGSVERVARHFMLDKKVDAVMDHYPKIHLQNLPKAIEEDVQIPTLIRHSPLGRTSETAEGVHAEVMADLEDLIARP